MTTSEWKGRFFLQNESIRVTNRIDSNRELECSSTNHPRCRVTLFMRTNEHHYYATLPTVLVIVGLTLLLHSLHTHTRLTAFVRDYPGEPVPEG